MKNVNIQINSFVGVASIQTMIRHVGTVTKQKVLEDCIIDGMVGTNTFNALNFIAGYVFGTRPHVPQGMVGLEDGILSVQRWYEGVRTSMPSHRQSVWPRLECDGVWGTDTYIAFSNMANLYCELFIAAKSKSEGFGLRRRDLSRPFIDGRPIDLKPTQPEISLSPRETVQMTGQEDDPETLQALANAMGWDNPVITPAQLLASQNGFEALITRHAGTKETLGILVYMKPSRLSRLYDFSIVGLYVREGCRDASIGTSLVGRLKTIAANQDSDVSFTLASVASKSSRVAQFLSGMKINMK